MAGHSQFKNIMHRKGAQDSKRAKIFAKLTREIIVSAKTGIPDATMNPRLRSALAAARSANMPKDNIDRALKKAIGGEDQANYMEIRYEGYGPDGVAVIVEALTDNRNRTASEVRSIFNKSGGSLGEDGSVAFLFDHVGYFFIENADFDSIFEIATENDADDVIQLDEGCVEVFTSIENFATVRDALNKAGIDPATSKLIWKPMAPETKSEQDFPNILKFIDTLENDDDVQTVYTNYHFES